MTWRQSEGTEDLNGRGDTCGCPGDVTSVVLRASSCALREAGGAGHRAGGSDGLQPRSPSPGPLHPWGGSGHQHVTWALFLMAAHVCPHFGHRDVIDLFGGVVVGGLVPVRVSLFLDGGQVTFWAPFPLGGPGPVITELMRLVSWTS